MEFILNINNVNNENLIFKLPIKNQNIKYINYYKIMYSNDIINLKYLLIKLNFINFTLNPYNNIYNLIIDKSDKFIHKIKQLEETILLSINNTVKKNIVYNLYNDVISKHILYNFNFFPNMEHFCLKISGIWEDETKIGLVYKFYYNISTEKLSNIIC